MLSEALFDRQVPFDEACAFLGYKRSYIYAAIAAGRLRAVKVGKYTRIHQSELQRFRGSITRPFEAMTA